ncbi:hypothetical protein JOF55_003757 [Haloactinomyces albus]|uniref:Transposase n=1 Tax=Haloactinomyces albus TaxID=1352928 RepID=A0AAE3ZEQ5_9ACTN|nr:hypothetical protein [Haloactinomyces albus]
MIWTISAPSCAALASRGCWLCAPAACLGPRARGAHSRRGRPETARIAPGDWKSVPRTFQDGHAETWWAADASLGGWGPNAPTRLVVATRDPATLPDKATWYLATNLARPGSARAADSPHPAAEPAEIVELYGIRHWVEQGYKQTKDELGWADFQARLRHRDPPPPVPGPLCFLLLLADLVRRTHPAQSAGISTGRRVRRERGAASGRRKPQQISWPRTIRAVRSWLTPRSHYNAGGTPGRHSPHPMSSKPSSTRSAQATASISTNHLDPTNYRYGMSTSWV